MKFKKSLKIALTIIFHSKIRSWLTILGIVIGIAAVVAIISMGQGAQQTLEQNLNTLNANILTITPGFQRAGGMGAAFRGGDFGGPEGSGNQNSGNKAKNLTTQDAIILKSIPNIQYVNGIISGSTDVSYMSQTSKVSIVGVNTAVWKNMETTELSYGRYLGQGDVNTAVVGGRVANSTFKDMQTNRQIIINGATFKIVGILKQAGNEEDSKIYIPIQNAVTVLDNKNAKTYDSILVQIKDISISTDTVTQITNKLMFTHGILNQNKLDFRVTSPQAMQERMSATINSMAMFLMIIAAISLIVGAIGIMNTMFTSVLERTKEIGILKSIGAKNRDILTIFLLNSGIIGLIGGIFGIILGIILSMFLAQVAGMSVGRFSLSSIYISTTSILWIFLLAVGIGVIAGGVPAYRASKLKPVDALRYE